MSTDGTQKPTPPIFSQPGYAHVPPPPMLSPVVWRDGSYVVLFKDEPLPERCFKTGDVSTSRVGQTLTWHPGWVYALLLLGALPALIVAAAIQKTTKVWIPLGDIWKAKISRIFWFGMGMILGGIGMIVISPMLNRIFSQWGWLMFMGFVLFLFGIERVFYGTKPVSAKKIDDHFVWIKGACEQYLAMLPQFPGEHEALYPPMPSVYGNVSPPPFQSSPMKRPPPLPPQ